jgi:peroxiredoxin
VIRALTLVVVALATAACAATSAVAPRPAEANATPPPAAGAHVAEDFSLRDVEGHDVRLSSFAGKVVLIDFWQTWCVPCAAEIPHLQRMYSELKDKGFVVLGISMDGPETVAQVGPFIQRNALTFPVLLDEETKVTALYNPARSAPLAILIGRDGRIVRTREGYDAGDEKLIEAEVKKLLE